VQQVVDSKFVEVRNVAAGCALLGEMSHLEKVAVSEQLGDQILALLNGFDVLQGFCLLGSLAKVDIGGKNGAIVDIQLHSNSFIHDGAALGLSGQSLGGRIRKAPPVQKEDRGFVNGDQTMVSIDPQRRKRRAPRGGLASIWRRIESNKCDLFGLHAPPESGVRLRALCPLQPTVEFTTAFLTRECFALE